MVLLIIIVTFLLELLNLGYQSGLDQFSSHEKVITLCLHGHTLSCLVYTPSSILHPPSSILDNSYGKSTAYYELWKKHLFGVSNYVAYIYNFIKAGYRKETSD